MYVVTYTRPHIPPPDIENFMEDQPCRHRSRRLNSTIVKRYSDPLKTVLPVFDEENWMLDAYSFLRFANRIQQKYEDLNNCYREIPIPKKNGKKRIIHDPNRELRILHANMKKWLSPYLYFHTSAFAYIKNRNIYDCIRRHQGNGSKWFLHVDLKDFFGQTSYHFAMEQIFKIYPFCSLSAQNADAVKSLLKYAFLDDGLPQGTTISPALTNLIMLPIDHKIYGDLHKKGMVYTRYADDIIVSSPYAFDFEKVIDRIKTIFDQFGAPYQINNEKTRYGSSSGRNWNLGLMLNKDGQITVGYRTKKMLKARLTEYYLNEKNHVRQDLHQKQQLFGQMAFYKMIEPQTIDYIERKLSSKFDIQKPEKRQYHSRNPFYGILVF